MKSFVLRLEEGLHERLRVEAEKSRRSMQACALLALEEFLEPKDSEGERGARTLIPPDELVGAKHDAVHKEPSGGRGAKTVRKPVDKPEETLVSRFDEEGEKTFQSFPKSWSANPKNRKG